MSRLPLPPAPAGARASLVAFVMALSPVATRAADHAPAAAPDPVVEVVESRGQFESQGKTIAVERFEPKAPGRHPAVLVLHGSAGMTVGGPAFRDAARRLAQDGFVAHVVHYFDLTGTVLADPAAMRTNFAAWTRVVGDGVAHVRTQANVDPNRIGLVGFSLGGYLALAESVFDPRVLAVVDYFGGLPDEVAKDVRSLPPVLVLHGEADRVVPVSEARKVEALCKAKGTLCEVVTYPGQGHGLFGSAGDDARTRCLAFLRTHVAQADLSRKRMTAPLPRPGAFDAVARGGQGE